MPIKGRKHDYELGNRGFMLVRGEFKGRAWKRTGMPDMPGAGIAPGEEKFAGLGPEIEFAEVWDDWSGGYGSAYRRPGEPTYHWGENIDARFGRQLIHAQAMRILNEASVIHHQGMEIIELNQNVWNDSSAVAGAGDLLIQHVVHIQRLTPDGLPYSGATGGVQRSILAGAQAKWGIGKPVLFGSYIYAGSAFSENLSFRQLNMGDLLASYNTGEPYGYGFANVGNRLWKFSGPATTGIKKGLHVQHCSPSTASGPLLTANWTASSVIGNQHDSIQDIIGLGDQLFIGTPEGLFAGDQTGTFVNVMPSLAAGDDANRDLQVFNGGVITQGPSGIYRYQPGFPVAQVDRIGPYNTRSFRGPRFTETSEEEGIHLSTNDRAPVRGIVRCTRGYGEWLYAGLWTGSDSHILAGQERPNGWTWHTMQRLPIPSKVRRLFVDSITTSSGGLRSTTPRMWALTEPSLTFSSPIFHIPIPVLNNSPLFADTGFTANYCGSARVDLGSVDNNAPTTPKVFRSVEIWADSILSGVHYCDVYYDVDHSDAFTLLGRANNSPKSTIYFSASTPVTGQSIELSLRSTSGSPNITPVYRGVVLRGMMRPRSVDVITAVTRIADDVMDRQGGFMRRGATMMKELRDMAATIGPYTLVDPTGVTNYVNVIPPVEEQEVYQQGSDYPEIAASVKMAVMTFS